MDNSDNVILVFLMYSVAMLVLPLFTFFAVRNVLEKDFDITGFANTAWSVICAVIMANIIIMLYAWRAFKQEMQEEDKTSMDIPNPSISSDDQRIPATSKSDLNLKKDE